MRRMEKSRFREAAALTTLLGLISRDGPGPGIRSSVAGKQTHDLCRGIQTEDSVIVSADEEQVARWIDSERADIAQTGSSSWLTGRPPPANVEIV
jgi:hypothetical protein